MVFPQSGNCLMVAADNGGPPSSLLSSCKRVLLFWVRLGEAFGICTSMQCRVSQPAPGSRDCLMQGGRLPQTHTERRVCPTRRQKKTRAKGKAKDLTWRRPGSAPCAPRRATMPGIHLSLRSCTAQTMRTKPKRLLEGAVADAADVADVAT